MKVLHSLIVPLFSCAIGVQAAVSWGFIDGTVSVQTKGAGVGAGAKHDLVPTNPLRKTLTLASTDTLKLALTTRDGRTEARPHQAFLTLREQTTGLQESLALEVKENGKAKLDFTQKDLPYQFLTSSEPIQATVVIASFGSSVPFSAPQFEFTVVSDPSSPPVAPSPAERYASKPIIDHIFRDGPKSPPQVISLFFTLTVLAALPLLLGAWVTLGGNLDHFGKAFGANPVAHGLFFGSILAMEGIFFLYYASWNLFQTLPAMAVVGSVAFVSGSRALTEVQERRLAGER